MLRIALVAGVYLCFQLCRRSGGTRVAAEYDRLHGLRESEGRQLARRRANHFQYRNSQRNYVSGMTVYPRSVPLGGGDLYEALETECVGWS